MISWNEKYRPYTLSEVVMPLDPAVRQILEELYETGQCQYQAILLHGKGGTGKTTTVDIIAEHPRWYVHKLDPLGENKAGIIRLTEILNLTPTGFGERHLVVGHEIEKSTTEFLDGLRGILDANLRRPREERFVMLFTDNHPERLVARAPEVFGGQRVQEINWNKISDSDILDLCVHILQQEDLYNAQTHRLAEACVKEEAPSLRGVITALQNSVKPQMPAAPIIPRKPVFSPGRVTP